MSDRPATYRFMRFSRELLKRGLQFPTGPEPGEPFPAFEVRDLSGAVATKETFHGRPALITLASITCPMTAAAAPVLRKLHREFGARVEFATLYVREAHPGERFPQADGAERKLAHARRLRERDQLPWRVLVDGVDGELHRALGGHPNAAYLLDVNGNLVYRVLWSGDERGLRAGLEQVAEGRLPLNESGARLLPLLSGLGLMAEVLEAAGPQAEADARSETGVVYGLAKLARLFRPLPPMARGAAAVAVAGLGLVAAAQGARLGMLKRRRP